MKLLKVLSIAITLLLLMSPAASAQAPQWKNADYDAVRDFSIQQNPNGVWSYGWESSLGSALNLYTLTDTTSVPGMSVWLVSETGEYWDDPPYVAHNDTDKKVCFVQVCVPPKYLHLHPKFSGELGVGELSVVRWTAPSTGRFQIEGAFMGLDYQPTTTDVHVLVNSKKSLLNGPITSYKWPLIFNLTVKVLAGDTVDFAVGWGKNDQYADSTGVRVAVTRLGK
jgi:hypothetical protein